MDLIGRARIVSAHVGGPTGAAIAPLLARRTRFSITEHATYVRAIFADTSAAIQYRAAVARASRVLAVSDGPAAGLRRLCPQQADYISAVPNPVRFDILPLREQPVRAHDRWLYVGNLVARKGVHRLLEAFAQEVRENDREGLHLTLVGDGPMRQELATQAREAGLADRVTFAGQVDPADVAGFFGRHDVLVHLSEYETFGLTVVEAAATGLPVVVTRCSGPEETMVIPAGYGLAAFVDVDPSPESVRAAVASLRTDHSPAQLELVRTMMRSLYGFERAADLLAKYVYGATKPALAPPLDLSIVVAFQGPQQWRRVMHGADRAADLGCDIVAVDLEDGIAQVPAGVRLVTPGNVDRYNALRTLERAVVDRAPRAVLRGAEKLVPRLPQRAAKPALRGLTSAERLQRRVANVSEQRVYRLVWGVLRGRSMARRVEAQPELAMDRLDVLVHLGGRLTQLAYRLAMRHPEAIVHHGPFNAAAISRWWLAVHGPKHETSGAEEL
nr:glycosyltransferase [Kineosphaera limosa]